jgi:cytochrome c oxidase subunit 1
MATAEVSNTKTLKVQRFKPADNPTNTYLTDEKGVWAWMTTVDHKKIGIMYLVAVAIFFALGGALAILLRTKLLSGAAIDFISADQYNQLFTLHGAIMVFFVLVPSIPAALGNFIMPMQLGAKDVAFPKLNLASFYIYVAGAIFTFIALWQNGLDTGWTFYTPYSTESSSSVIWVTMGVFILGFSSILTGTNFITTIHKMRAPGITWGKLPLNVWALYATSIIQVLATPVLAITVLLLTMERWLGFGIFDPALGGDPVLFQHFFWFYSHPAVYIMIVPGFGIISEVISTFSKKTVFGYWAIALSSLAIAFIGFLVWGHHMFTSGQSAVATTVFSFLTFLVGIPTGIKIFNWIATLYKGSIKMDTPMIYVFIFLFLFSIGGFTGIMLGALSVDIHLHDTYYVVAHFHYVMMGGTLIALLAGLHFWWPKMTGKLYNEKFAKIASVFIFVGFNVTFLPQFVMGAQGMPRRYYNYVDQFTAFHQTSTIGSYLLGVGFLIILYYLMHSLFKGAKSPANPWGSRGLEWQATSPPDFHNFDHTPVVIHGPYDYHQPMEEFQLGLAVDTNGHDSETAKEVVDKEREQWKNYSLG